MLEEATVQATQALVTLFWVVIVFIVVAAVTTAKTDKRQKA